MREVTAEELSAYLDHELAPEEERELEQRLAESPGARKQLEELASVVRSVKALDSLEAPVELHQKIQRIIELDTRDSGLGARLAERRSRYLHFPAVMWAVLGTIVALGVITVILSDLFDDQVKTTARSLKGVTVEGLHYQLHETAQGAAIWIPEGWRSDSEASPPRRISLGSREGSELLPPGHPLRALIEGTDAPGGASLYMVKGGERLLIVP